jgi:predicted nucleic acid-binding protein
VKVIVDTSVWSLALRRRKVRLLPEVETLRFLIEQNLAVLLGPIRQEILSGIKHRDQFDRLHAKLSAFEDLRIDAEDYVRAALLANACLLNGVQASHTDFLIAAVAVHHECSVLTTDKVFVHIARLIPVKIHEPG